MNGKIFCQKCLREIYKTTEKYVLVATYDERFSVKEEKFYHWICFVEWYEGQVRFKAENIIRQMTENAMGVVKGLMGSGSGGVPHVPT